jgi:hypothetical protein
LQRLPPGNILNVAKLGIDDAYIFFYAENFASGHGMVYNVGTVILTIKKSCALY